MTPTATSLTIRFSSTPGMSTDIPATIGPATGTITCGTSGTCLTYDANGNMVEKKSLRRLQRDSVQPNREDGYDERTDGNQRLPSSSRRRNSVFNWQYCCHSALLA